MQDQGRSVDPDLVGPQGLKASGAKPEMVGGSTAPTGAGARFRAQADAAKDISNARGADLDKALNNLVNSGDVKKSKPSGPSSSIGFRQFSMKANKITQKTKEAAARSAAAGYSQSNKPKPGSVPVVYKPKKDPLEPFYRTTGGSRQPKVVNPSTNKPEFKNTGRSGYRPEYKPTSGSAPVSSKPGDITLAGPSKSKPSFQANPKGSELAKKSWGQFSIDSGRTSGLSKVDDIIDVDVKVDPPANKPKALPGTAKPPKPSSVKLPPARKNAALAAASKNAPVTQASLNKTLRGIGGRALGLAGAGYDAVSSYQEYKKRGDSDLRAGVKSAFRTGLGYAGGALGGLAGAIGGGGIGSAVTGTAGAIGGYSAGTWLADKILGATRYERKKRAREKAAAKAAANQK